MKGNIRDVGPGHKLTRVILPGLTGYGSFRIALKLFFLALIGRMTANSAEDGPL